MKKGSTFAAVLLGALLATAAASSTQAGWTEVKAGPNGHFIARAYINGVSARAIIDTGASTVAIPYRVARRIGLRPAFLRFDRPVATANGVVKAARVRLRRVEIEGVVARDVEAMVLPKGALAEVLIGMSYLGKLRRYAVSNGAMRLYD